MEYSIRRLTLTHNDVMHTHTKQQHHIHNGFTASYNTIIVIFAGTVGVQL